MGIERIKTGIEEMERGGGKKLRVMDEDIKKGARRRIGKWIRMKTTEEERKK